MSSRKSIRQSLSRFNPFSRLPSKPAKLAAAAGRKGGDGRPDLLEQLESRQMLFTHIMGSGGPFEIPDPLNPGAFIYRPVFGYVIPYLAPTTAIGNTAPTRILEDFNSDDPFDPGPNPNGAALATGTVFDQSNLRLDFNVQSLTQGNLAREVPATQGANQLRFTMQAGDRFTLHVAYGAGQGANNNFLVFPTPSFPNTIPGIQLDVGGAGLNSTFLVVRLIDAEGVEVAAFTGAALDNLRNPITGTYTFAAPNGTSFQDLVFESVGGPTPTFTIDNVAYSVPAGNFAQEIDQRIFSAAVDFRAPAGATIRFLDLYGRDMRDTIRLGIPPNATPPVTIVDPGDDGIPDYNDGFGAIIMTGTTGNSTLLVNGGEIESFTGLPPAGSIRVEGTFAALQLDAASLFDAFEQAGYGYIQQGTGVNGLPEGPGRVIIGSPWVRPLNNYNPGGGPFGGTDFNRAGQGIFTSTGESMDSVIINGILHGSSQLRGFANTFAAGYMMGSLAVAGDLGTFTSGTDAGCWASDDGLFGVFSTNSTLTVGRSLGAYTVAGRSAMTVTVFGDLNSPTTRPPRNSQSVIYREREGQGVPFGLGGMANNTVLNAEWVGSLASSVEIRGSVDIPVVGGSDMYYFAVDGTQDIVLQNDNPGLYIRIMDVDGRTLAATQQNNPIGSNPDFTGIRYRPTLPGVYYINIMSGVAVRGNYNIHINGLAPTTFGEYRTGAGTVGGVVTLLSGSMGSIRVGTGIIDTTDVALPEADPAVTINELDQETIDDRLDMGAIFFNVPGTLYNITAGSDINPGVRISTGGNFGTFNTGMSALAGIGPRFGDVHALTMDIGGSIAMLDFRGAIGITQNVPGYPFTVDPVLPQFVTRITTGRNMANNPALKGDIGLIRVGSHVGADLFDVTTPDNSIVGGFLVSQDLASAAGDAYTGIYAEDPITTSQTGVGFHLGFNSDLRFFDAPQIDLGGVNDKFLSLVPDVSLTLTDDSGATIQMTLRGGTANGRVVVVPVSGSLGVAVGRIEVNLAGDATLDIVTTANASGTNIISVGRIVVTNASANSNININGTAQLDVWRIEQTGGDLFGNIQNDTPGGDIVVADMIALTSVIMGSGDLGRTQVIAWGPQKLGVFLGVTGTGGGTATGGPIIIPAALVTGFWNGDLYRPVFDARRGIPPGPWLDDLGSPVSPFLNGLIVRTGSLTSISSKGGIGDVIVDDQANDGVVGQILSVIANSDGVRTPGRPDDQVEGIFGNIFATRILSVDVGSGLVGSDQSPFSTAGIVATDDIGDVVGGTDGRVQGAFIKGMINAANLNRFNADGNYLTDGINSVQLTTTVDATGNHGGIFDKAFIGSMTLDSFWRGLQSFFDIDPEQYRGRISLIKGTEVNLFRSQIWAENVESINLNGTLANQGFYDATLTHTKFNVTAAIAKGYRNSTVSGNQSEFYPNQFLVGQDILSLTTQTQTGDIEDLNVDALGHIVLMTANIITRSTIDADIEIASLHVFTDLRSTTVTTGLLTDAQIDHNIRSSQINVSGELKRLNVVDEATNTSINVSGPDGLTREIIFGKKFTGSIRSAGPILRIEVTNGSLDAILKTSTNLHGAKGDIGLITASGDIILDADVDGTITRIVSATGSIGNRLAPKPIVVHGGVESIEIPNGQLYSDFRIDQGISSVIIGAVSNKPGSARVGVGQLIAFGHIENVTINGDFGGKIISYSGGISNVTINNGSLLTNAAVQAFAGDLVHLNINSGHLLGTVHADFILWDITVTASPDGVFGDLGINPALSQGNPTTDPLRNQLPPGVVPDPTFQGPRITAGHNIGRITVSNGSIFEAFIFAGRAIGTISVNGDVRNDTLTSGLGTVISAGSSIFSIAITGSMANTIVLGGVRSFGNDGRPGGVGANADTIRSSRIESVVVGGTGNNVAVSAGMAAGADGIYNTGDERVVLGTSYVRTVTFGGGVSNVTVYADSPTLTVSPGVFRAGTTFALSDSDLSNGSTVPGGAISSTGAPFAFNLPGGITGSIVFHGPGQAFYDNVGRRVILLNTSLASTLTVSANGTLTDFDIVTNDDASMGSITVAAPLAGDSDIVVDAYCVAITVGNFSGTGSIKAGMNLRTLTTGNFTGGTIGAAYWVRDIIINGNFGTSADGEARIDAYAAGSVTITGTDQALINVERDLNSFNAGVMNLAQLHTGGFLGSLSSGPVTRSRVSIREGLGPVVVNGSVSETSIQAGGDLGDDAAPGGTGFNADSVTTAGISSVVVNGNFTQSDVVAGLLRGPDGFFGTFDDGAAAGRSSIGSVQISGTQVGSNLSSQSYGVIATGFVGDLTVGGILYTPAAGSNFKKDTLATRSNPLRVQDVIMSEDSQVWFATFVFNQDIDAGSVAGALSISEVRNGGLTLIPLVLGTDYAIQPSPTHKDWVVVRFFRSVTDRNLVPTGGVPVGGGTTAGNPAAGVSGPGVFRFVLSASTFRAAVADARLQGDPALQTTADFSQDVIVGDAGDKLTAEVNNIGTTPDPVIVDMYGPADLDLVMDNNQTPDGQPDINLTYIVRGVLGDHPDHNVSSFRPASDSDLYKITLRAGQILRLGAMQGAANQAGQFLIPGAGGTAPVVLPADADNNRSFLILTTGTYVIAVSNSFSFLAPGDVSNLDPGISDTGAYSFSVQVFDDGDSGFGAATDSGDGAPVANAPTVVTFAGPNGIFQNENDPGYDDLKVVTIGDYKFTLDAGLDGVRGTSDDIVSGANSTGIRSERRGNSLFTSISSAIGPTGHNGVPGAFAPDSDVFVLNNGQTIAAGRTITIKVKLADIGADLGTFSRLSGRDLRGNVQFGLFDVTNATGVDDGSLIFSPTDFKSTAQKLKSIATQGSVTYGYDDNGDYFITFVTTGPVAGLATDPAKYAIYIQGVFNTDYTIEITQNEATPIATVPQAKQNVLIETRGGTIDWLEAGGLATKLAPFSGSVLGFTGAFNNLPADEYILTNLVAKLNSIFAANGLNVQFSTNPADFEFQDFSRVYISASSDPVTIFNIGNPFNNPNPNAGTPNFGYSEHSDPFNLDRNDEAAIFLPSMDQLTTAPSQTGVDSFILSLTAAVGRRAGELMGLRIEADDTILNNPNSIMAANSVSNASPNAAFLGAPARALSGGQDTVINTNFFIGQQNAFALLDKFLTP